jgi:uncharacterized protein (TIGR00266 family)
MNFDVRYRPAHSLAIVHLEAQDTLRAEATAMVSMSTNVAVETLARGRGSGVLKSLKRSVLGGESFFTNTFRATQGVGEVTLAPRLCGDMVVHELGGDEDLFIQGTSYVASDDRIDLDAKFQGLRGLISGEGMFFLKASGVGPVLINAFGAIDTVDFDGELIVDTGHLVALTSGIQYEITKASPGWIASYLSGEGLVLRVRGAGTLYLQTRNPSEYGSAVGRMLPPRQE